MNWFFWFLIASFSLSSAINIFATEEWLNRPVKPQSRAIRVLLNTLFSVGIAYYATR